MGYQPKGYPVPGAPAGRSGPVAAAARPLYFWLLVGAAICLVSLFFQWEPGSVSGRTTYVTRGFEYSDGTRSTWTRPEAKLDFSGGGNGFEPVKLAAIGFVAYAGLAFRQRPWPRWAIYTLAGVAAFMGLVCVGNLAFYPGIGVILFTVGTGLVAWVSLNLFRRPAA